MQELIQFLVSHGMWGTAAGFFLQGVGVPVPLVVNFGWLHATVVHGHLDAKAACGLALVCSWSGNVAAWLGGRAVGNVGCRIFPRGRIGTAIAALTRKHLAWGLLASRWLGGYPQLIWTAGATRYPFWPLTMLLFACDALWVCFWWTVARLGLGIR